MSDGGRKRQRGSLLAAKAGTSVPPYVNQKAPKEVKTTAGKVLPRMSSKKPPTSIRMAPKPK
jgi:hypothetical protein